MREEGCGRRDAGGMEEGCRRDAGGMQEGWRRDAGGMEEGGRRDEGGRQEGWGRDEEGMQEGGRREAGGMQEGGRRDGGGEDRSGGRPGVRARPGGEGDGSIPREAGGDTHARTHPHTLTHINTQSPGPGGGRGRGAPGALALPIRWGAGARASPAPAWAWASWRGRSGPGAGPGAGAGWCRGRSGITRPSGGGGEGEGRGGRHRRGRSARARGGGPPGRPVTWGGAGQWAAGGGARGDAAGAGGGRRAGPVTWGRPGQWAAAGGPGEGGGPGVPCAAGGWAAKMAAGTLRLGDLVWGKLGRYPPWPGKIVNPPKDLKKPRGKKCFFVKFFGTEDHAWIKVEQLKPYHPHKEEMIKINKGKRFQQAVDAVEEFLRKAKGKDQASSHSSAEEKNRHGTSEDRSRPAAGEEKRRAGTAEGKVKKSPGEGKRRVSSGSSERGSRSPLKRAQEQSPRKRGRPPKDEKDLTVPESSTVKGLAAGSVAGFKWPPSVVSEPGKGSDPHFHHFLLSQTEKPAVCYQAITKKLKVCEEETGSTSIQAADSTAVNGSITPTDKKIGFLGLGLMGSGIVSNLLKMGHTVTVWSRTAEKCDLFIQEGARLGRTPAEVVSTCDITFACVSDPKAAKDLVLGPSGVLQGIRPGKCYVDMSTVDADTVTELAQVIVSRGGRFLEAPVSGNQQLSNDGLLVILAAGDRGLYEDCSSCFQAMGKTSFFLGEVGNAAKMMLIVNMVQGSFMATIAEGLTLAQVTGQSQQTLLDILNQGQLASIFLDQKCQNILQGNFKPDFYLKYIQKDLRLAIALGDSVNHPTPMAAAANEVYKRAKALDQSDNDMSAVYRAYIH
uniref:Cytokine-like nuclear factor N-PAC n=2 Tax=Ornithorhynchus anatinus TaxID=9258 RepID=A0A6I8N1G5_ORNAN